MTRTGARRASVASRRLWPRTTLVACSLVFLCAHSHFAAATDWTLSGLVGDGNHVLLVGTEAQLPSRFGGPLGEGQWSWSLSWAGDVSYWRALDNVNSYQSLWEVGFTPVATLRRPWNASATYYLEAGIGVHLLSHTRIDEKRQFSSAFQFGEFLGTGVNFGERQQYGIGVRVQHISNGGIKEPNCGITFGEVRLSYAWN